MKIRIVPMHELGSVNAFRDVEDWRDERQITTLISTWRSLGVSIVNIFAPRGYAFFNFGRQLQLEELSFETSQSVIDARGKDDMESDLRAMHLDRGRVATFLMLGGITQSYGDYFYASSPDWHLFSRRHISVAVPADLLEQTMNFLAHQERVFDESCLVRCSDAEQFVFERIDDEDYRQRLLYLDINRLTGDDIRRAADVSAVNWLRDLPGLWSDPCPIRLIDPGFARAETVLKLRLRVLSEIGTFAVKRHWLHRIESQKIYPADLSDEIVGRLRLEVEEYPSIIS